jgi:hypothetical protein
LIARPVLVRTLIVLALTQLIGWYLVMGLCAPLLMLPATQHRQQQRRAERSG